MNTTQKLKAEELLTALQLLCFQESKQMLVQEFNELFTQISPSLLKDAKAILLHNNIITSQSLGKRQKWIITYISPVEPNMRMCEKILSSPRPTTLNKKPVQSLSSVSTSIQPITQIPNSVTGRVEIKTQEQFLQQVKVLKSEFEKNTSFKVNLDISFSIVQKHQV